MEMTASRKARGHTHRSQNVLVELLSCGQSKAYDKSRILCRHGMFTIAWEWNLLSAREVS